MTSDWHHVLARVSGQLVRGEERVSTHELLTVHLGVPVTDRTCRQLRRVMPELGWRGPRLMRSTAFTVRATEQAWTEYWQPMPSPGWHDLFALTKRGVASLEGDFQPLLQNLQFFKDLLALPRRLAKES